MPEEVELKFDVTPGAVVRLTRTPWFRQFRARKRQRLISVYFDTDKLELRRRGVTLRVRHIGARRVQTIKTTRLDGSSGLARQEWEKDIDSEAPDLKRVKAGGLEDVISKKLLRKLRPIFETDVHRTIADVRLEGARVELAIDRGSIKAGKKNAPICEVELELKDGDPQALLTLARKLAQDIPVRYDPVAKAERGYGLSTGEPLEARSAEEIFLDRGASVADAFRTIGLSCLRHVVLNESAVLAEDAEGVHQMRIALRRLRTAMSLFKALLGDPESQRIKAELIWLTNELGPARELDVFVGETVAPLRTARPYKDELGALKHVLEGRKIEGVARAEHAVDSRRCQRLLLDVALWLAGGQWSIDPSLTGLRQRPAKAWARKALAKLHAKIARRAVEVEHVDARRRHKIRIAAKKMRYAAEFFWSLFPAAKAQGRRKKLARALKGLQNALGKVNDITAHRRIGGELISAEAGRNRLGAKPAFALGLTNEKERGDVGPLLFAAVKAGARLAKLPDFAG